MLKNTGLAEPTKTPAPKSTESPWVRGKQSPDPRQGTQLAYIRHDGFVRHLRSTSTAHIVHLKQGRVAHEDVGVSFSFRELTAAISEIPTAENELPPVFVAP